MEVFWHGFDGLRGLGSGEDDGGQSESSKLKGERAEDRGQSLWGLCGGVPGKFFLYPHPDKCGHSKALPVRNLFQFVKSWFVQSQRQHPFLSEHQILRFGQKVVFGGQAFLIVVIAGQGSKVKGESQEKSKVEGEREGGERGKGKGERGKEKSGGQVGNGLTLKVFRKHIIVPVI